MLGDIKAVPLWSPLMSSCIPVCRVNLAGSPIKRLLFLLIKLTSGEVICFAEKPTYALLLYTNTPAPKSKTPFDKLSGLCSFDKLGLPEASNGRYPLCNGRQQ